MFSSLGRRTVLTTGAVAYSQFPRRNIAACASAESPPEVKVFQYKICPFCNRVKAYLDHLRIPYVAVEVNPITKTEVAFSKEYKKVPIVLFDDEQVNDSTPILNYITSSLVKKEGSLFNKHKDLLTPDTEQWSEWSEKKLAVMLYPNITRNFNESWECFEYTKDIKEWSAPNRYGTRLLGAVAMMFANGRIKKKYNIVDERKELTEVLEQWTSAVGDKNFLHGNKVTLPDIMVFGVLRGIEGLSTFNEVMSSNPALAKWYANVDKECPSCERVVR